MTEVRWTLQAADDLRAIREFIERDSPRYGRLVADRLFTAPDQLEDFPESGGHVPEMPHRTDLRQIVVGAYKIVYRVGDEVVEILTVFRSSQLFPERRVAGRGHDAP